MARLPSSGNTGSRSYSSYSSSYSGSGTGSKLKTETFTLEDAIMKSGNGELNPLEVYVQMPLLLQEQVDQLSTQRFSKKLSLLTLAEQCEIMKLLYKELKEINQRLSKPLSVTDILEMAKKGAIDDIKMYQALPAGLQKYLDAVAKNLNVPNFSAADRSVRLQTVGVVLNTIVVENEKRIDVIKESRLKEKQCVMCGEPLGVFGRFFGAKQHGKCTEWKE